MARSKHPGVWLVERVTGAGNTMHVARWRDPRSGKRVEISLDKLGYTNDRAREIWAKQRSAELARERQELAVGAGAPAAWSIADAVANYTLDCESRLAASTMGNVRETLGLLEPWLRAEGVATTAQITPLVVSRWAAHVGTMRRQRMSRGKKRGAREPDDRPLSPATVSRHLRITSALLNWLRLQRVVKLSADDVRDLLKTRRGKRAAQAEPRWLTGAEIRRLLDAAVRYDEARRRDVEQLAPAILLGLLTGCRFGELLALQWRDVDLKARDEHGRVAGEIVVRRALEPRSNVEKPTKTSKARTLDLSISPALSALLAALKLRAGRRPTVLPDATRDRVRQAKARLEPHDPPDWNWLVIRHTTATYLTNAPGVFGAASLWRSCLWLGHEPDVAKAHYLGLVRGIPRSATTLEAAMGITEQAAEITRRVSHPVSHARTGTDPD